VNIFELMWFVFFAACVAAAATIGAAWFGWPGGVLGAAMAIAAIYFVFKWATTEDHEMPFVVEFLPCRRAAVEQRLKTSEVDVTISGFVSAGELRSQALDQLGKGLSSVWVQFVQWSNASDGVFVSDRDGNRTLILLGREVAGSDGVCVVVVIGTASALLTQVGKCLRDGAVHSRQVPSEN